MKADHVETCPVCAARAHPVFAARDYNRRCSRRVFHYARCPRCRLIFLIDPPADLGDYYAGDYFHFPTRDRLAEIARKQRHQLEMLMAWVQDGRILEVGPAHGAFALQASQAGFEVTTIEMDAQCCRYLESVVGVTAVHSDRPEQALRDLPLNEAIVMWQVIEHLRDPWGCLNGAVENLRVGGFLLIATPNPGSLGLRLLGRFWPHLDAPRHLTLIPPDVLTAQLSARGLERVALWTDDPGARSWNRFGWQRAFMNCSRHRVIRGAMFAAGAFVAAALAPIERRGGRSSSYTAIFRKATPE